MQELLKGHNIWFFIFSTLPAIIYAFIIYISAKKINKLSLKNSIYYIVMGLISIQVVTYIQFIFPHIQDYIQSDGFTLHISSKGIEITRIPTLLAIMFFAFIQVGMLEELSKLSALRIGHFVRNKKQMRKDTPYSIMFYSVMISVGFAVFENITYVMSAQYRGASGSDIQMMLLARSINSVILHMLCGLFMGYFIALGRGFSSKWKYYGFTLIGLIVASAVHGYYDYNLMIPYDEKFFFTIWGLTLNIPNNILIISCIGIATLMGIHLRNKGFYKNRQFYKKTTPKVK